MGFFSKEISTTSMLQFYQIVQMISEVEIVRKLLSI